MLRSPVLFALWAVAFGLVMAGGLLLYLKPNDRAIVAPGAVTNQDVINTQELLQEAFVPPRIIVLGAQDADAQTMHLVLGGDPKPAQRAYQIARDIQSQNDTLALNIIPAFMPDDVMYQAFSWALRLPKNSDAQADFIDAVMNIGGEVTVQSLMVVAQNMAIDVNSAMDDETQNLIDQALEQSSRVLPPALPAIWFNDQWLTADDLTAKQVGLQSGQSTHNEAVQMVVNKAYAYATPPNPKVGVAFMQMKNLGHQDVTIIRAFTPVAGRVELHNHFHEEGALMMREVPSINVGAGEIVTLKPDGLHVMLYDLPGPLAVGQTFPITLVTDKGIEISTLVTVTPIGQALTD